MRRRRSARILCLVALTALLVGCASYYGRAPGAGYGHASYRVSHYSDGYHGGHYYGSRYYGSRYYGVPYYGYGGLGLLFLLNHDRHRHHPRHGHRPPSDHPPDDGNRRPPRDDRDDDDRIDRDRPILYAEPPHRRGDSPRPVQRRRARIDDPSDGGNPTRGIAPRPTRRGEVDRSPDRHRSTPSRPSPRRANPESRHRSRDGFVHRRRR